HDLRLVVIAAAICFFACATFTYMLTRMKAAQGKQSFITWLIAAGFVAACGIWGTHFIAMLAFKPGFAVGYDVTQTIASALIAITLCILAFGLVVTRAGIFGGGTALGLAISLMHITGMMALRGPFEMVWDHSYLTFAVLAGIVFSTAALWMVRTAHGPMRLAIATILFALAICSMHFTAMTAVSFHMAPILAMAVWPWRRTKCRSPSPLSPSSSSLWAPFAPCSMHALRAVPKKKPPVCARIFANWKRREPNSSSRAMRPMPAIKPRAIFSPI
ncbi:MAG TPA: MHYT domain-containing protein, partial [Rhizomicrobium sp.]